MMPKQPAYPITPLLLYRFVTWRIYRHVMQHSTCRLSEGLVHFADQRAIV